MNVFEDIIASILIDIIKAQNRANEYSAELVPHYRDPKLLPNLGYLPIPNTAIKSFDVKLSFAVDDLLRSGQPDALPANLFGGIHNVLMEIFDSIGAVRNPQKDDNDELKEIFVRLKQMYFALLGDNKKTHTEKTDILGEQILKEMEAAFAPGSSMAEREKLLLEIKKSLQANLKFSYEKGLPVNLDLDVMKNAGDKILASINCQVDMRNYQLGFTESVDASGETSKRASLYPA